MERAKLNKEQRTQNRGVVAGDACLQAFSKTGVVDFIGDFETRRLSLLATDDEQYLFVRSTRTRNKLQFNIMKDYLHSTHIRYCRTINVADSITWRRLGRKLSEQTISAGDLPVGTTGGRQEPRPTRRDLHEGTTIKALSMMS